ncbi:phosphatase PAP2 family protein [Aestuariimicrobium ganziense]|uniref:phosphatase PAP2 family protein n=1 Tax=Aestuariimicrobium ganziense TaxID=2773677 RepID=UPI0019437D67|nr:phosphatase PAP2 family protein [Aestuariimicrobium ganziense]
MDADQAPEPHVAQRAADEVRVWNPWSFAIGLIMLVGGVLLAREAGRLDPHSTGEYALGQWMFEHRSRPVDLFVRVLEFIGGPKFVPYALVVLGLVLILMKRRIMGLLAWLMPALGWLPGHFVKKSFPRERPPQALEPVVVYHDTMSFPSGHTGFATSITIFALFALTMWGLRKWWMVAVGVLVILTMAWSRVYAAAHFYFDVIGGAALAGGTSLMLWPLAAWAWTTAERRGGFWAEPNKELPAKRTELDAGRDEASGDARRGADGDEVDAPDRTLRA